MTTKKLSPKQVKNALLEGKVISKKGWSISINSHDDVEVWAPNKEGLKTDLLHLDRAVSDFCKQAEMPIPGSFPADHPPKDTSDGSLGEDTSTKEISEMDPTVNKTDVPEGKKSDPDIGEDTETDEPFTVPAVNETPPDNVDIPGSDPEIGSDTSKQDPEWVGKAGKGKQAAFMEPQVWEGDFVLVDDGTGGDWVEKGYEESEDTVEEELHGWGAQMSAPGYMDRTDLTVHQTEEEAIDYLFEQYMTDLGELDPEYEEYREIYEEYASRQGWDREGKVLVRAQGKFDSPEAEKFWEMSMDGMHDWEAGDSETMGWFGGFDDEMAIVMTDSQGFVYLEQFGSPEEYGEARHEIQNEEADMYKEEEGFESEGKIKDSLQDPEWVGKAGQYMEDRIEYGEWAIIEDKFGETFIVPGEYKDDSAVLGDGTLVEVIKGYGAYLTMPGYLDQTEIEVFKTEEEAEEYLQEMYGDDDFEDDDFENDGFESEAKIVDSFDGRDDTPAIYRELRAKRPSEDLLEDIIDPAKWAATQFLKSAESDPFSVSVNDRDPEPAETSDFDKEDVALEDEGERKETLDEKALGAKEAGPKLREKWDDKGGYGRDIEAEDPRMLSDLVRSFGGEDVDWTVYQQPVGDEATEDVEMGALKANKEKEAVDDAAKEYYSTYYGDYGSDLTKGDTSSKDKRDKGKDKDKKKKDDKKDKKEGQAAPAPAPVEEDPAAPVAPAPGGEAAPDPAKPAPAAPGGETTPGAGDAGLKALGWTQQDIQVMDEEDKQKILKAKLNKPGTKPKAQPGAEPGKAPAPGAPPAGQTPAPGGEAAPAPAEPAIEAPVPKQPVAHKMAALIQRKLLLRQAQQMLQQPATVEAPQPAAPATEAPAPTTEVLPEYGEEDMAGSAEQQAFQILSEVKNQEVTGRDAQDVMMKKVQQLSQRLQTEAGMTISEAKKLYGVNNLSKLFQ